MSFDPPRLHASPTDAVLGSVVFQAKSPEPTRERSPWPPVLASTHRPADVVTTEWLQQALLAEVRGLRADLQRRHDAAWHRRLARWTASVWHRLLSLAPR